MDISPTDLATSDVTVAPICQLDPPAPHLADCTAGCYCPRVATITAAEGHVLYFLEPDTPEQTRLWMGYWIDLDAQGSEYYGTVEDWQALTSQAPFTVTVAITLDDGTTIEGRLDDDLLDPTAKIGPVLSTPSPRTSVHALDGDHLHDGPKPRHITSITVNGRHLAEGDMGWLRDDEFSLSTPGPGAVPERLHLIARLHDEGRWANASQWFHDVQARHELIAPTDIWTAEKLLTVGIHAEAVPFHQLNPPRSIWHHCDVACFCPKVAAITSPKTGTTAYFLEPHAEAGYRDSFDQWAEYTGNFRVYELSDGEAAWRQVTGHEPYQPTWDITLADGRHLTGHGSLRYAIQGQLLLNQNQSDRLGHFYPFHPQDHLSSVPVTAVAVDGHHLGPDDLRHLWPTSDIETVDSQLRALSRVLDDGRWPTYTDYLAAARPHKPRAWVQDLGAESARTPHAINLARHRGTDLTL